MKHEAENAMNESLGDDAACVRLRLQVRLLHGFHLLLLGFGLHVK